MPNEITLAELRIMAQGAGLHLGDDELNRLLPGVIRARKQAAELREFASASAQPAGIFTTSKAQGEE